MNLLFDPLIRAEIAGQTVWLSLPQVYAELVADRISSFPALRPHQRSAWHMFLVQLGALALHRANLSEPPETPEEWERLLRGLTAEVDEETPWALVVDDLSKPAFLQPPVPECTLSAFKNQIDTPDALDILITSKNFDLKESVAHNAHVDDWVFALISLQTMEGFLGSGNYGISRMNGGFSTRPFMGPAPIGGAGAHIANDLRMMLKTRNDLLQNHSLFAVTGGLGLVWLTPWDGKDSLPLTQLDPWYIEICRRVRFVQARGGALQVKSAGTKAARIDAKALKGVTGDFWAPVNRAENKAVTLDARGFSARALTPMLFPTSTKQDFQLPLSFKVLTGPDDMQLVCRGMARGQGKTEGYHERIIPLQGRLKRSLLSREARETAGKISERQLKEIAQISSSLRFACAVVSEGGSGADLAKDDYHKAAPFVHRLEHRAEEGFFASLSDRLEHGEVAKAPYLRDLIDYAHRLLEEALDSIPSASFRRPRARVRAERAFWGSLWSDKSALSEDKSLIMEKTDAA